MFGEKETYIYLRILEEDTIKHEDERNFFLNTIPQEKE